MTAQLRLVRRDGYDPRAMGAACEICPLYDRGRNTPVPPSGPASGNVKLVIIGEGPGQLEERTLKPFVGMSGSFLNKKLEEAGGADLRKDAWVTNATLCLEGNTQIRMADGTIDRLDMLVKRRSKKDVLTVEEDGSLGSRPVVGWYRNALAGRLIVQVTHRFAKRNPNGVVRARMTSDHKILSKNNGWIRVDTANGELIATGDKAPIGAALDIAIGTLLGDSCIPRKGAATLVCSHAEDQRDYAEFKARTLGAKTTDVTGRNGWQPKILFRTYSSGFFRQMRAEFYDGSKKRLPIGVLSELSDLSLAIWYLDDGYMKLRDRKRRHVGRRYLRATGKRGLAEICVAGFQRPEVTSAVVALKSKGFDCYVNHSGPLRIKFTALGTVALSKRIAKFVPPSMQYKLLPEDRDRFDSSVFAGPNIGPYYDEAITTYEKPRRHKTVYCLDVEKTHNFVTTAAVVHNCRPEGENSEKAAAVCCAPRLYNELRALPKEAPILALGKSAAASILNVKSILLARGFVWTTKEIDESAINALVKKADKTHAKVDVLKAEILKGRAALAGRKVFPTIHPAFVLRLDSWHPVLKVDIERFVRFFNGEINDSQLEDVGPYRVLRTPERVERELAKLRRDCVAVDIETDDINPLTARILCVGVGDGYDGVVIRWDDDENKKNALIPQLAKILSDQLEWRQAVVFHNGYNFDQIALERDGVTFGDNVEDTLLALHSFASHLPKRLDWLASIYSDANPWKIKFGRRGAEEKGLAPHHMPKEELWLYNSSDVRLTARGWRACQTDLEKEHHIYEHDKQLAQISKEMQVYGIPVDTDRQRSLSKEMEARGRELKWKMKEMTGRFTFRPSRLDDVRWAMFDRFGAPVFSITSTGLPSTSNGTIEALRSGDTEAGRFADLLLQWRAVTKVRSTYCNTPEAPIWMTDGSFKALGDIAVGDRVMGWRRNDVRGSKTFLTWASVLKVQKRVTQIVKVTLASGRTIRCTPDHLWLKGEPAQRSIVHNTGPWRPAIVGRTLAHVVDIPEKLDHSLSLAARWLGGMFDGEGSVARYGCHKNALIISQSPTHNLAVCDALRDILDKLNLHYVYQTTGKSNAAAQFRITGRQSITNFLSWCNPVLRHKAARALFAVLNTKIDEIISIEPDGVGEVISLTTSTGNYVAWGYGSKNCDSVEVDSNGFAHFNWRIFGTVSGRWSCRLQSCPRWSAKIEDRARELYCAKPGYGLWYFDLSQSEMRGAAYLSGDQNFIATCESGDVHTGNARILFPQAREILDRDAKGKNCPQHKEKGGDPKKTCNCGKPMRDIAKNSGFGVLYSAEVDTIFTFLRGKGFDVTLNAVQAMFDLVKETYSVYYEYCENNLRFCKENGWQRTALLGRRRTIGYFPKPGDVYNFKVQSLIADLMNLRLLKLKQRLRREDHVVAQVHDALIGHSPLKNIPRIEKITREIWAEPIFIPESGCTFTMPIDWKTGERWSSFG